MENIPDDVKAPDIFAEAFKKMADANIAQSKQIEQLLERIVELKTETSVLTLTIQSMLLHSFDNESKNKIYNTAYTCLDAIEAELDDEPFKNRRIKYLNIIFKK